MLLHSGGFNGGQTGQPPRAHEPGEAYTEPQAKILKYYSIFYLHSNVLIVYIILSIFQTLPISNASEEQIFFCLKRIKNDLRFLYM